MRQTSLLLLLIVLLPFSCDTEQNVPPVFETFFTKYYGEDGNQVGVDLLVNTDGTMILLGNSSSQTDPVTIPFIVKIDPEGTVLWQREMGELNEEAVDVEVDSNNNLIVVTNVGSLEDSGIRILRINQDGRGLDSIKIYNSDVTQTARSVTLASDGSFLIAGSAGPTFVDDPELINDESDLLIYRINEDFSGEPVPLVDQGGEHVGKVVKVFQSKADEPIRYIACGDSDRPLTTGGKYRESFEVSVRDEFGKSIGQLSAGIGDPNQLQRASTAIETPGYVQEQYLTVGSSYTGNSSNIFIAQYAVDSKGLTVRLSMSIPLGRRMEGISAAPAMPDGFFILANEFSDNNKGDIFLLRLADDGAVIGSTSFGSLEGDDAAGAVKVLADGRIAVFGTIELETQRKMVLIVISPDGKFSNG